MIRQITDVVTRHYRDNGQTTTYVYWLDERGNSGSTRSDTSAKAHMLALLARAKREGCEHRTETW